MDLLILLIALLEYAVLCLPGFFIIALPWKRTRQMRAGLSKHAVQSSLIAFAFAPMIYRHAMPGPAYFGLISDPKFYATLSSVSLLGTFVISLATLTLAAMPLDPKSIEN